MKGYKEFQQILRNDFHPKIMKKLGLKGEIGDVNRLSARIVFVHNYKGIHFDNYSEKSARAYSSIFRIFLAFSALELFTDLFKCKYYNAHNKFPNHPYDEISAKILLADKRGNFIDALLDLLDGEGLKKNIEQFRIGSIVNPFLIGAAIRHSFAHGDLSANANDTNSKVIIEICDLLYKFLLEVIDVEFYDCVINYSNKHSEDT